MFPVMNPKWGEYIQRPEDDWTSVGDTGKRRRIQNRLAQRARRAKASPKAPVSGPSQGSSTTPSSNSVSMGTERPNEQAQQQSLMSEEMLDTSNFNLVTSSEILFMQSMKALSAFRAISNLLQLSCNGEPGFHISPLISVPVPLTPTPLQETVPHYPYVDIIPFPVIRNKILSSISVINEEQLCNDLQHGAMAVWGDVAWDPLGWEISEDFLQKWWFLLDDEVIRSSNFWRRQRGEGPLKAPFVHSSNGKGPI